MICWKNIWAELYFSLDKSGYVEDGREIFDEDHEEQEDDVSRKGKSKGLIGNMY